MVLAVTDGLGGVDILINAAARAEQELIGLGSNCQPKQADTPRSQF